MAPQQLPWQWLNLCRDIAHTSHQNPCKSQNTIQCSKNSDKIPNHLLISNLKKYQACKKGMRIVKDFTSARAEIQKHNAEEFFCKPPRFLKTTNTAHWRQGGILCSGEDRLPVKAKIPNPCCHPIPQNAEEWLRCQGRKRVSAKYPHPVHFTPNYSHVWCTWVAKGAAEERLHSPSLELQSSNTKSDRLLRDSTNSAVLDENSYPVFDSR